MINGFETGARVGKVGARVANKSINVNTNVKIVKGEDGFSPVVSLTKVNGVATLTITDKSGTKTVNIYDGDSGEIPEEVISTAVETYLSNHPVETLTEDDVNTLVANYVTAHKSELKGDKGDKGDTGADGYTPVKGIDYFDGAKGDKGDSGYTPVKGVDYFDGQNGQDGTNGQDGYTPVKGVDYFTSSDKTEIVNSVLSALTSAESVSV